MRAPITKSLIHQHDLPQLGPDLRERVLAGCDRCSDASFPLIYTEPGTSLLAGEPLLLCRHHARTVADALAYDVAQAGPVVLSLPRRRG